MAKVEGLDELLTALDETSLNLVQKRKLIVKALREASKPMESESKSRYQTAFHMRTGLALSSISTSVRDQTSTGATAEIGPTRFYPKFGEYGTVHQSAHPWLGPSFDAKMEDSVKIIGQVIGDGVEEVFGS